MTKIVRAINRIEWKGFLIQPGSRMLLDDVHLNGEVFLPGSGMTHIPFDTWLGDEWFAVEESDIEMKVYNDIIIGGITVLPPLIVEPMVHHIHEHIENLTPYQSGFIGAEVGVWRGDNAEKILRALPIQKLYLIDTYEKNPNYQYGNPDLKEAKEFAKKRLEPYADKIEWMYVDSTTALSRLANMLDFCYHDSDHRRPCVEQELPWGYQAVREGGVWGGHDYKNTLEGECEVKSCVDEFFIDHDLSPLWYSPKMLNWWHVKG